MISLLFISACGQNNSNETTSTERKEVHPKL